MFIKKTISNVIHVESRARRDGNEENGKRDSHKSRVEKNYFEVLFKLQQRRQLAIAIYFWCLEDFVGWRRCFNILEHRKFMKNSATINEKDFSFYFFLLLFFRRNFARCTLHRELEIFWGNLSHHKRCKSQIGSVSLEK